MDATRKAEREDGRGDSLKDIEQRFELWRGERKRGERIPLDMWAAAVSVAKERGSYRVAIELGLDYAVLKRRVGQARNSLTRAPVAPRFVELFAPAASTTPAAVGRHECMVELENARGAKMRVELNGHGLASLPGLCSAFWSAP